MKRIKLMAMMAVGAIFAISVYAGDMGDAALTETKTFTMDGSGTHTITNNLGTTGSGEWWTAIEVSQKLANPVAAEGTKVYVTRRRN